MPASPADENLLFGILALQLDFITRDALIAAMHAWVLDKDRPLGDILEGQGALAVEERALLAALVARHLGRHGDAEQSLAALSTPASVHADLRRLTDPDLEASLARIGAIPDSDREGAATANHSPSGTADAALRYRVLRPHARGGLGEVFVAEDTELGREVALKQIRETHATDPDSRSRFLREAEVNGRLEHPGIVPVYGLGRDADGRPFYAMRFIRGETLREAIRRLHEADRAGHDPGEHRLALRQLLTRFVAVCNAVAYAHSRGVIHRDLKPANVMLGRYGETLVVDWGLAKVVGRAEAEPAGEEQTLRPSAADALATRTGATVGTPAFMAPEQAAGRLDLLGPATDVYGLGATLYCLLTGEPPFRGGNLGELLQRVTRGDCQPASQVKKGIPAALEAVCRKAMALRPLDRYAGALELAADVEHWLADEPVSACRESWPARVGRLMRRRRTTVAAVGTAVLAALLLGGGGWVWYERDRAVRQADEARRGRERDQGVAAELQRVAALRDKAREAPPARRHSLLAEALAAAKRADGLLAGGGDAGRRRQVGELVAELERGERDRRMLARLEEAQLRRTASRGMRFDDEAGDRAYWEAFREYGCDLGQADWTAAADTLRRSAIRAELASALEHWALLRLQDKVGKRLHELATAVDPDEVLERMWQAFVRKRVHTLKRIAAPAKLAQLPPATADLLANALNQLGAVAEAEAVLRQAQHRHPGDFWVNFGLGRLLLFDCQPPKAAEGLLFMKIAVALRSDSAGAHVGLSTALGRLKEFTEMATACRRAIALAPDNAIAHNNLGSALFELNDLAGAAAAFRTAMKLEPKWVLPHHSLGNVLFKQGDLQGAVAAYRAALKIDPTFSDSHRNLGHTRKAMGDLPAAFAEYRRAIALNPKDAEAHCALGGALYDQQDFAEAAAEYREAIARDPTHDGAHFCLGNTLRELKDLPGSFAAYREALDLNPKHAGAYLNFGTLLQAHGDPAGAIALYRKALALVPADALADNYLAHAQVQNNLGNALGRQGDVAGAVAALRRAIALDPKYGSAYTNLGHALNKQGNLAAAVAAFRKGVELSPKSPVAHLGLGNGLRAQGDPAGAVAAIRKAIDLDPKDARFHSNLGDALRAQGDLAGAAVAVRKAIDLDPKAGPPHVILGMVLEAQRELKEAVAAYRASTVLDPQYAPAHLDLARGLRALGDPTGAVTALRGAITLKPDWADAHLELGNAFSDKGELDGAIACYRKALELRPALAAAHANLGFMFAKKGRLDEALAAFRKATEVNGDFAQAYLGLGNVLQTKGRLGEAIAAFRKAAAVSPAYAEAYCNLGLALQARGEFAEAVSSLRRGHQFGGASPRWRYPSAEWLRSAERLLKLDHKLSAVRRGAAQPADNDERVSLAQFCQASKQLYAASARLWQEAFAAQPGLATDVRKSMRYHAALAAALAGCGKGADGAKLDDQEKARWRKQALDWLRADLALWETLANRDDLRDHAALQEALRQWHANPELAGFRDTVLLADLPQAEGLAWLRLWVDVAALLKRSRAMAKAQEK